MSKMEYVVNNNSKVWFFSKMSIPTGFQIGHRFWKQRAAGQKPIQLTHKAHAVRVIWDWSTHVGQLWGDGLAAVDVVFESLRQNLDGEVNEIFGFFQPEPANVKEKDTLYQFDNYCILCKFSYFSYSSSSYSFAATSSTLVNELGLEESKRWPVMAFHLFIAMFKISSESSTIDKPSRR